MEVGLGIAMILGLVAVAYNYGRLVRSWRRFRLNLRTWRETRREISPRRRLEKMYRPLGPSYNAVWQESTIPTRTTELLADKQGLSMTVDAFVIHRTGRYALLGGYLDGEGLLRVGDLVVAGDHVYEILKLRSGPGQGRAGLREVEGGRRVGLVVAGLARGRDLSGSTVYFRDGPEGVWPPPSDHKRETRR